MSQGRRRWRNKPGAGGGEVVTVHPSAGTETLQKLSYFVGISDRTAGARGISMNLVVIPPGARSEPHLHCGFETAIYLLSGRVQTCYGDDLKRSVINGPGDFLYIPENVPHQAVNLSDTEPAVGLVARNCAGEQEDVQLYPFEPPAGAD
ncbi:cupin [Marinobacterium nitratireducens]|uniref:Cupin n=1 Tax=Marinobacterium nitratireducens TaxID=518897 RepID=A0A917Z8U5_9GAMM|nr:cupin domain-containing protein [Marinobacterium nitratireducens]GGO76113.1 cupin [Marinobacterium nitratireducens]